MNLIRIRRTPARRATPPGTGQPSATQRKPYGSHLASWPGRDGLAARFTEDLPAGASVTVGQNRPAPATANSRWRTWTMPRVLPHTVQLCIHCRHNPAGFWVSRSGGQTVRRPWCLSCCQDLDPRCYHVTPFES